MHPTRQHHTELKASPVPRMWTPDPSSAREQRHRRFRPHSITAVGPPPSQSPQAQRTFLLQRAQPALSGLIDGSLSSLAPIFAVALATHTPRYAFFCGLATAIGAGVSMSFSEGLRTRARTPDVAAPAYAVRSPAPETFIGGFLHTLPFLIPSYTTAVLVAVLVVMFELATLAFLRMRFFQHQLRHLATQRRARRRDHRRGERSAWIRRQLTGAQVHPGWQVNAPSRMRRSSAAKCIPPTPENGAPTPYRRWLFVSLGRDSPTPPLRNLVGASLADPYVRTLRPMRT